MPFGSLSAASRTSSSHSPGRPPWPSGATTARPEQVGVAAYGLAGQPACQLLARVEPAVVAVPQRTVGSADGEHRLGRGVPAGAGPDNLGVCDGRRGRWLAAREGEALRGLDGSQGQLLGILPAIRVDDLERGVLAGAQADHVVGLRATQRGRSRRAGRRGSRNFSDTPGDGSGSTANPCRCTASSWATMPSSLE